MKHDDQAPRVTDYLWDRSGAIDGEVERLEMLLAPYRMEERPLEIRTRAAEPEKAQIWRFAFAMAACAVTALALLLYDTYNNPPSNGWQFVAEDGQAHGRELRSGLLRVGESIQTTTGERVTIRVASIGEVELRDQSQVKLVENREGRQRLAMEFGTLHARIYAPPAVFVVDTPAARAIDLGCEYTLNVDRTGAGHLSVDLGWVQLEYSGEQSLVPRGMVAEIAPGGLITPAYHPDATTSFKKALIVWSTDDQLTSQQRSDLLRQVLNEARHQDSLTIVNLFRRANSDNERAMIFDRLNQLVPAPAGINRDDVIADKHNALNPWWPAVYDALHLVPFQKTGPLKLNWYP